MNLCEKMKALTNLARSMSENADGGAVASAGSVQVSYVDDLAAATCGRAAGYFVATSPFRRNDRLGSGVAGSGATPDEAVEDLARNVRQALDERREELGRKLRDAGAYYEKLGSAIMEIVEKVEDS
jgi:hypothetical protein